MENKRRFNACEASRNHITHMLGFFLHAMKNRQWTDDAADQPDWQHRAELSSKSPKKPNHEDSEEYPASLWPDSCAIRTTWSSTCADKWSMLPLVLLFFFFACREYQFVEATHFKQTPAMHWLATDEHAWRAQELCSRAKESLCTKTDNCWHWSVELLGCSIFIDKVEELLSH